MNILIIEDEKYTADLISRLVLRYNPEYTIIAILSTIEESVNWFLEKPGQADLVLLDIQLTDGSSFDIFEKVRVNTPIIFITAYNEFAINAFKVNSIDYLLKPVNYQDIKKAFLKYHQLKDTYQNIDNEFLKDLVKGGDTAHKKRFLVKTGERYNFVQASEIAYFMFEEGVIFACLFKNKKVMVSETLDELSVLLDPEAFFRLNRKFISSVGAIGSIHTYFNRRLAVHLNPGDLQVIVSRERVNDFKLWLNH
ncbi:MAG: LytTR family DNA-binding domain-containing protein [Prolixibacteraceae bacterium]|nr:LytTR family DNA-binding domain-containing protein [Prolixibacteraceae bacterium]